MKTSDYQLCEMLRKATGFARKPLGDGVSLYISEMTNAGCLRLPFDPGSVFVIYDRLPVLSDLTMPTEKSLIVNQLSMRREDTGLVVDSLRSGKDALFFTRLCERTDEAAVWVVRSNPRNVFLFIKPVDDEHILITATVRSFVHPSSE